MMRYGSVCSGIEAATLAWEPLGWEPAFFSETDKFPGEVLRQRWPDVPNLGDFTKIRNEDYDGKIELLTGGTPCQSFSMAGLREGVDDERGNLCFEFAKLAFRTEVRWILWENVPGVLSSNGGKDFAGFLSLLCGWEVEVPTEHIKQNGEPVKRWRRSGIVTPGPNSFGLAWRVLDVQYVRVDGYPRALPQRRRRLFVVGYIGNWFRAAAVLFDRTSMSGNLAPERKTGKTNSGTNENRNAEVCGYACMTDGGFCSGMSKNFAPTLTCGCSRVIVLQNKGPAAGKLRYLLPVECERLMGFPDNYTQIEWRGKKAENCPDGPRYKVCGNSQGVNVMRWLGKRIDAIDKLK